VTETLSHSEDKPTKQTVESTKEGVRYAIDTKVGVNVDGVGIGFVTTGLGMGHWYLQQKGVCRWHVCGEHVSVPHRTTPVYHPVSETNVNELVKTTPVEVLIFLGQFPGPSVWKLTSPQLIIWVVSSRLEKRMTYPPAWNIECFPVSHDAIGGVTNGCFDVHVATRRGSDHSFRWSPPQFTNPLNQVLDPTLQGQQVAKAGFREGTINTPSGLLQWTKRSHRIVVAPTVYSDTHFVRRKLSTKELANALDVPADALTVMEATPQALTTILVPGKVIAQVISSLSAPDRGGEEDGSLRGNESQPKRDPKEDKSKKKKEGRKEKKEEKKGEKKKEEKEKGKTKKKEEEKKGEKKKEEKEKGKTKKKEEEKKGEKKKEEKEKGKMKKKEEKKEEEEATERKKKKEEKEEKKEESQVTRQVARDFDFVTIPQNKGYDRPTGFELLCGDAEGTISAKATKSDDAGVPEQLWDKSVIQKLPWLEQHLHQPGSIVLGYRLKRVFRNCRKWLLQRWKKNVLTEMEEWMEHYGNHLKNPRLVQEIVDQIKIHVSAASWWNWDGGSTLFFWRWPVQYMSDALHGTPPMFVSDPPNYWKPQPPYKDPVNKARVKEKLEKVIDRGYLKSAGDREVLSLMFVFDVEKGEYDIRLVYDGSKSGLNDAIWAPWFPLPTADSFFDVMMPNYWCSDNDMGDFFLNFPMHEDLQKYCGVDITELFPLEEDETRELHIAIWTRAAMGITSSPYIATALAGRSNRLILGIPTDPNNPFAWDIVVLNLPGTKSYDCTQPWIFKCRTDGKLAADTKRFVDDLRNSAPTEELAWTASTQIGKTMSWLGQQDAPRKRRPPSKTPGAWAATVVATIDGVLTKSVTQAAWDKAKQRIRYLAYYAGCDVDRDTVDFSLEKELNLKPKGKGHLIHKIAEKYRGYLIHISATYSAMVPYLKGLHLTLDGWREGRDDEGWKDLVWYKFHRTDRPKSHQETAPTCVACVDRLKTDLDVLLDFFDDDTPYALPLRPTSYGTMYIVGDASGTGFGNTAWSAEDEEIAAQFGGWEEKVQEESSNFREAYTAVLGLEDQLEKGKIQKGCEVFIVTDNWVTERVFENGSARTKKLHELVVRLRRLQMKGQIFIRVLWMAGTRMIAQGTDSLSRGDLCSGVMAGDQFLDHIPLSLSAPELQPQLLKWLHQWATPETWIDLEPRGWFTTAFEDPEGCFIWAPPPAIARQAIDCLCDVHHIHPFTSHIVIVPSLMSGHWRKRLSKCSDALWVIKSECDIWPHHLHEPLTIAFVAPQLQRKPWRLGRSQWLEDWHPRLRRMFSRDSRTAGRGLRQFWNEAHRLKGSMPECLAPEVLREGPGRWIPCTGGPRFGGFDR